MQWLRQFKQRLRRAASPDDKAEKPRHLAGDAALSQSIRLDGHEKQFFEQALKLYIFSRHVDPRHVSDELSEQLTYCANVVYSLILNWLRDGRPSIEYLEFLNSRIAALRDLPEEYVSGLEILPHEINELELMQSVPLRFTDADSGEVCRLAYYPAEGLCKFSLE